jgi:hypothetical protein
MMSGIPPCPPIPPDLGRNVALWTVLRACFAEKMSDSVRYTRMHEKYLSKQSL